jgi:anionic cell wall polymer biosynthesis LytR-Cps2A-Psr (LCP) family protein
VSNLLNGIPIKFYVAMNLDGISVLNDSVGGITVTLEDDFSHLDPTMTKGTTMTLVGGQAETFVRSRMSMEVGTNEARMQRQEVYMSKLTDALLAKIKASSQYIGKLFDEMEYCLCTNMSRARIVNEAWAAKDYQRTPVLKMEGTHNVNENDNMEFHPNESALEQMILDVFYIETK